MSDIFISYASDDRARVEPLAEALEAQGWSVWWDRVIPAGKRFDQVIQEALNAARCVVVLWTKNSVSADCLVTSDWVKDEVDSGAARKILVPVLMDDVKIPFGYGGLQAANLIGWQRTTPHLGFDRLVKDLSGRLGSIPAPDAAESFSKPAASPRQKPTPTPQRSPKEVKRFEPTKAAKQKTKTEAPEKGLLEWVSPSTVRTLKGHTKQVNTVAFSPDGAVLATGAGGFFAGDNTVRLWSVPDGKLLRTLEGQKGQVECVAFSPDGATLISAAVNVWLWRLSDGARFPVFERVFANHIALSPDGTILASAALVGLGKTVELWRTSDGENLRTLESPEAEFGFTNIAFSPDGANLAAVSIGNIVLWRVSDGKILRSFEIPKGEGGMRSVAFSPDGKTLAAGGYRVWLWRVSDGTLLHKLLEEPHSEVGSIDQGAHSVAFSPDSAMIGSGYEDKMVRLWRVADGKLAHTLTGHQKKVNSVAFSPDGTMLASASDDQTVRLWLVAQPNKSLKPTAR